jgi:hypothetical protein
MTRDGVVEVNETQQTAERISSREADSDFLQPDSAAAERVIEHLDAAHTRKANKKAVKKEQEATFLVVNMADTKRKLENDIFAAAGIAQKYNCRLTRLDYQQEAGLLSSVPIGENLIPIQRGLTTSSTAIFIPFITQELFQTGQALLKIHPLLQPNVQMFPVFSPLSLLHRYP